ncbi:MAG TPA: STAS domain-containing protein [Actinomycetota bacterium]|nr:STAS domain-containing protein [Actinomycetota bacterium]
MTSELADVGIERMDGVVVATVSGEIDMSNAARVRQRITGFVTPEDWAVVLDLSGLTFIDSAGLHGVSVLAELLEERRQRLFLSVPPGGSIARTVELVGLHSVSIHADRDLAIAAAQANKLTSRPYPPDGD